MTGAAPRFRSAARACADRVLSLSLWKGRAGLAGAAFFAGEQLVRNWRIWVGATVIAGLITTFLILLPGERGKLLCGFVCFVVIAAPLR